MRIKIILARVYMLVNRVSFYFVNFFISKVSLQFKETRGGFGLFFLIYSFTLTSIILNPTIGSS